MARKYWLELGPSLLVAAGILAATLVAVLAAQSRWGVSGGLMLLALAVVSADVMDSRLRGTAPGPSWAARILVGSFLTAGLMVDLHDPGLVSTLIPTIGVASWVVLLLRPEDLRKSCNEI
jgi:hypothetical protein